MQWSKVLELSPQAPASFNIKVIILDKTPLDMRRQPKALVADETAAVEMVLNEQLARELAPGDIICLYNAYVLARWPYVAVDDR